MHRNTPDPVVAVFQASSRLLRQNPALWVAGFLVGVLAALLLSTHTSALDGRSGLQVLLHLAVVGLSFPLGWVVWEYLRTFAVRRRRVAPLEERVEE